MIDIAKLLQHRSEPDARAVLEDWCLTYGHDVRDMIRAPSIYGDDGDGDGYGDGDGDGGYGGDGYGGYGGDGDGGYGGAGGDGYGGYGDGDGDGYGDGGKYTFKRLETDVREGLTIVTLPSGGSYPYVLVGWLRRVQGDEYELAGARCIKRFGQDQALASLAENGPWKPTTSAGTKLLDAATQPELVHRLHIGRAIPCNKKAWAKWCPKP